MRRWPPIPDAENWHPDSDAFNYLEEPVEKRTALQEASVWVGWARVALADAQERVAKADRDLRRAEEFIAKLMRDGQRYEQGPGGCCK